MQIKNYRVIYFSYSLHIANELVQHSPQGKSQAILTGFAPDLPKGLESALLGKQPGEYNMFITPDDAYGIYDPAKKLTVNASDLPDAPRFGGGFSAEDEKGNPLLYRVIDIQGDQVTLDANHEWAGKTLEYRFTIHKTRPAEPDEITHGHVHGEGGVEH